MKFKIFLIFIFLAFIVLPSTAAIEGDIKLLKYIADADEVYGQQLRTWGGSAEISFVNSDGVGSSLTGGWNRKKHVEFLIDRDADALRWNSYIEDVRWDNEGEKQNGFDYSGMFKSERAFQMFYDKGHDRMVRTLEIMPQGDVIRGIGGFSFDPVDILEQQVYPNLSGMMRYYYEHADDPNIGQCRIFTEGDVIKFESVLADEASGQRSVNRLVFDLSKDCRLIEFEALGPLTDVHWHLDYEQAGDMYVVKSISRSYLNKSQGNESQSEFKVEFTTNMLNEKVDPQEFEFDRIGLRPGDRILDRMVGELVYTWKPEHDITEVFPDDKKIFKAEKSLDDFKPDIISARKTKADVNSKGDENMNAGSVGQVTGQSIFARSVVIKIFGLIMISAVVWFAWKKFFVRQGGKRL